MTGSVRHAGIAAPRLAAAYGRTWLALRARHGRVLTAAELGRLEALRGAVALPVAAAHGDLVVPVHDNAAGLRNLLGVLAGADWSARGRIVLVDDHSGDPECRALIAAFAAAGPDREAIFRPARGGFAAAVNDGIGRTRGDVVVLNTDIRLDPSAPARLLAHLAASPKTASVTPMTSSGFLVGVPDQTLGSPALFADGWRDLDALAAAEFAGVSEPIPVGTAFCMAVRRSVLEQAGGLPETGVGYGEDTEFSLAARRLGYDNRVALDCFVAHEGGASYGPERPTLIQEQTLRILTRYPDFPTLIAQYLRTSLAPLVHLRLLLLLSRQRPDLVTIGWSANRSAWTARFAATGQTHEWRAEPGITRFVTGGDGG